MDLRERRAKMSKYNSNAGFKNYDVPSEEENQEVVSSPLSKYKTGLIFGGVAFGIIVLIIVILMLVIQNDDLGDDIVEGSSQVEVASYDYDDLFDVEPTDEDGSTLYQTLMMGLTTIIILSLPQNLRLPLLNPQTVQIAVIAVQVTTRQTIILLQIILAAVLEAVTIAVTAEVIQVHPITIAAVLVETLVVIQAVVLEIAGVVAAEAVVEAAEAAHLLLPRRSQQHHKRLMLRVYLFLGRVQLLVEVPASACLRLYHLQTLQIKQLLGHQVTAP